MNTTLIISAIVLLIIVLLLVGAPIKPMQFLTRSTVKLGIGILLLFFVNVFGGAIGLHIPINVFTVVVSGFLGLFGVASLSAIQLFLFV